MLDNFQFGNYNMVDKFFIMFVIKPWTLLATSLISKQRG